MPDSKGDTTCEQRRKECKTRARGMGVETNDNASHERSASIKVPCHRADRHSLASDRSSLGDRRPCSRTTVLSYRSSNTRQNAARTVGV